MLKQKSQQSNRSKNCEQGTGNKTLQRDKCSASWQRIGAHPEAARAMTWMKLVIGFAIGIGHWICDWHANVSAK